MTKSINISILDDDNLFSEALAGLIDNEREFEVLYAVKSSTELFRKLESADTHPLIVIVDIKLHQESGLDIASAMRENYPDIYLIALSSYYKPLYFPSVIELGFSAFLSKNSSSTELFSALKNIAQTGVHMNINDFQEIQKALAEPTKKSDPKLIISPKLTARETEILQLICEQKTNSEIAETLFLSARTIEGHRNRMIEKLGVKNTAGLVVTAILDNHIDHAKVQIKNRFTIS